ncbi:general secretion pathway protein GspB [Vibrio sp. CAU 1672]|uniref:general secretion pathway protein GspB n=1 Tax=Vibrio sp. CAU 1672 TaxID=3032594 RepID=UPI0023DA51DD|nr:general secretion pathway protein GspB [Vibrio sp. CAU 1672]MDF2153278.1 general secretion pathway protein GspB [Vibrio sp. CAU 1672]
MSVAKHLGLLLLPISTAALGVAWHLNYLPVNVVPSAEEVAPARPPSREVSPFRQLSYPQPAHLAQLSRDWPIAELPDATEREPAASKPYYSDEVDLSLDELDLSSLAPELARKVENALAATSDNAPAAMNDLERDSYHWQGRLPALNLQTHMYTSDSKRRWVKINNVEYHQGDVIEGVVVLQEIQPQAVVVEFEGERIRIPALYEWQG